MKWIGCTEIIYIEVINLASITNLRMKVRREILSSIAIGADHRYLRSFQPHKAGRIPGGRCGIIRNRNECPAHPVSSDIIYAGVGYSGGTKAPVYKSVDGGITWTASHDGIPVESAWNTVTDLEFHRQNPDIVYAGTLSRGVYISPNQGKNWLNLGTPECDVLAISTSSLYTATQGGLMQCTGTGLITGRVTNALSEADIHSATVFNDLGIKTISVNGEYMMVSPSGICAVTAIADGYANETVSNITVYGGDVTWRNIAMQSGVVSDPAVTGDGTESAGGGSGCFIATTQPAGLLWRNR
jgi:hypothetical protein